MAERGIDWVRTNPEKDPESKINDLQRIVQVQANDNERLRSALVQALLELDAATKKLGEIRSLVQLPGEDTGPAN